MRNGRNKVLFSQESSRIQVQKEEGETWIALFEKDGLYEVKVTPLYLGDERIKTLPYLDITLDQDRVDWHGELNMELEARLVRIEGPSIVHLERRLRRHKPFGHLGVLFSLLFYLLA